MAIEAIEDRPMSPPETSSRAFEMTALAERIDSLERQHSRLKWDSLLIAGVTTIAVALIASMMLQPRPEAQTEAQLIVRPRTISAQSFVLTDPQGHPRARLTFE